MCKVNKLYREGVTSLDEGIVFDYCNNNCVTLVTMNNINIKEIDLVKYSDIRVGVSERSDIAFISYKFGGMDWMNAPYDINLSGTVVLPRVIDVGYSNAIIAIDGKTGIIKAFRDLIWSKKLSIQLRLIMERQQRRSFSNHNYNNECRRISRNYDPREIIKNARIEILK